MTLPSAREISRVGWVLMALALLLLPASASALDPERRISQYGHAVWRVQDGHLPGMPMAVTQGPDGYLWIGTVNGLVRFDGVAFARWSAPKGEHLPSDAVLRLLAASDGRLWIGTQQGLSQWYRGSLRNYPATPGGSIMSITEDRDHAIWITRMERPDSKELLCRVSHAGEFDCFGESDGLALPDSPCCPAAFLADRTGTLWLGTDTALTAWRQRASTSYKPPLNLSHKDMGVTAIVPRAGGGLWVGIAKAGPGLGLQQFVDGKFLPFASEGFDGSTLTVSAMLQDRRGALWIGTFNQGLFRIFRGQVDRFAAVDGLSADHVNGLFEDREGSIWIATAKGVDQFRDLRVTSFTTRQGLASDSGTAVTATRDGSIWISTAGLDVLRNGTITHLPASYTLPDGLVTDVLEDHAGRLWVGVDRTLSILDQGKRIPVRALDGGTDIEFLRSLAEDSQHDVWARASNALFRIRDGAVAQEYPLGPELEGRQIIADPEAGIWLGLKTGELARFRDGKAEVFPLTLPAGASINGFVEHMATTPSGAVLGATANGVVAWKSGKVQRLDVANGLPCNHAHALVSDKRGNLWVFMQCGLAEVPQAELERWWLDPRTQLKVRVYDVLDGVDAGWAPFRGASMAPDGKLWFANGRGVQMIDPAAGTRNRQPPPVHIEALVADRVSYPLQGELQLPPGVRDLRVDYTATSFVIPQRVQFRYKLLGRDVDWQEPVSRRQAFYTDLQPGTYRFVVIARNDDGVWNQKGDSIAFRIAPAWHQTLWFRIGAVSVLLLLGWLAYRWRVRRLSDSMRARFDERLAERLRIARELHDTLLQSVQAGKLVADDALDPGVDEERRRHALERISAWLGDAIDDGRAALNSLRRSTALGNDLAEGLQQAAEEYAGDSGIAIRVSVAGEPREMHPIVRDEIYRIGHEAIRNATSHSRCRVLEIDLAYSSDFTLKLKDDGVGIDPADAEQGRDGHFGLQGMKERAQRIGGRLAIARLPAGGTEVRLHVPGRSVFR